MQHKAKFSCSLMCMNLLDVKHEIEFLNTKADFYHVDIMDGHFVKNITFGTDIMKAVKESTKMYVDAHLVVSDPEYYADIFMDAGADGITFHLDAINNIERSLALIKKVKKRGKQVGITLYPEVDVHEYLPYLEDVELVLVMSIKPGFGGQPFREDAISRIAWLDRMRKEHNYHYQIQVDGGINGETGKRCADAGADILVAGSYVFKNNIPEAVQSLLSLK